MLEQAISCHGAEESSLQAAESSWVCGLKGFFNYSKGPELKVGFPKILSLPFHREEIMKLGLQTEAVQCRKGIL